MMGTWLPVIYKDHTRMHGQQNIKTNRDTSYFWGDFLLFFSVFEINFVKSSAGNESLIQFF